MWDEIMGQTRDIVERLLLSAGFETPRSHSEELERERSGDLGSHEQNPDQWQKIDGWTDFWLYRPGLILVIRK